MRQKNCLYVLKSFQNSIYMHQRLPEDNSLGVTVCSSEHKIFSDEESSTEMTTSGVLQGDHILHRVLRDFYPMYDFSSKGCKDKLKSK